MDIEEGVGDMGVGGTIRGIVDRGRDDAVDDSEVIVDGGVGTLSGRPEAAKALTTASQPFSRVLILSLSSSFSFSLALSFSRSSDFCASDGWAALEPLPTRSRRFSSSSSATRRSRYVN